MTYRHFMCSIYRHACKYIRTYTLIYPYAYVLANRLICGKRQSRSFHLSRTSGKKLSIVSPKEISRYRTTHVKIEENKLFDRVGEKVSVRRKKSWEANNNAKMKQRSWRTIKAKNVRKKISVYGIS